MSVRNRVLKRWLVITLCMTVVALVAVGAWVYIQHENLAQQKQLAQYEQQQINDRANKERKCEAAKAQYQAQVSEFEAKGGLISPWPTVLSSCQ